MSGSTILAFDYIGYVAAGWIGATVLLGAYALNVVRRGRKLSPRVPPGERRWS